VNIKKISLLVMMLFSHIDTFYAAAGEEKNADRLGQISFRDEVINNFKINFVPLRQGFDLIGLNYDYCLEAQREFIPENGDGYECEDNDVMKKFITNAENIIIERMKTILEQGFQRAIDNQSDIDYQTMRVLDYAIYYKLSSGSKILRYLVNIPNIVIDAVIKKNLEIVNLLITAGADIDILDSKGRTLLINTVRNDNEKMVQTLITAGADINTPDSLGLTPLIHAVRRNHPEVVNLLITAGADIDVLDSEGRTPLLYAMEKGYVKVVQLLVAAGADVNIPDIFGRTPLMRAAERNLVEIVKLLLVAGANVNVQSNEEITALIRASEFGCVEIVKLLVAAGADINDSDGDSSALMGATSNGYPEIVKLLIAAGADINFGNNGQTVMDFANEDMRLVVQQAVAQREEAELNKIRVKYLNYDLD